MNIAKRGLNRGLDSLLSDRAKNLAKGDVSQKDSDLKQLPLDKLDRGVYQPRQTFAEEALQELADSIKTQGVIQPIVVRRKADQRYEIIAGERRWRAARLAGLDTIPAIVRELEDKPALAIAIIENIQRQDLNVLEEAIALQRLLDEFSLTQEAVATAVGKSRSSVANLLRLLNLPADVQVLLHDNKIEMGHARALLALSAADQSIAAKQVVQKNLSVRETERLVQNWSQDVSSKKINPVLDTNIQFLQNSISEKLGAKVAIQHNIKGKGRLEIYYHSVDELEGILEHIQ
jgi:ParB family chromosome partitioning protein